MVLRLSTLGTKMSTFESTQDGLTRRVTMSYFGRPSLYPDDGSLLRDSVIDRYFMHGLKPAERFVTKATPILAFGSCFASNIRVHLQDRGYNVLTNKSSKAHVTKMGDGLLHTHAILQQFEWVWENKVPVAPLWDQYNPEEFGFNEPARIETKELFETAELFIITLGLSEIWFDEPTGEVFWRVPPREKIDPARHKFRVASFSETKENIHRICQLIQTHNSSAKIVITVSPVPLAASFRELSALSANAASKSIVRAAVDEFFREEAQDSERLFYFPSYDVVTSAFDNQFFPDRRHVNLEVLDFNMKVFEHYYCIPGIEYLEVLTALRVAQAHNKEVARNGQMTIEEFVAQKESDRKKRIAARGTARDLRIAERKAARVAIRIAKRQEDAGR